MNDLASLQKAFQRHVYQPGKTMEKAVLATPAANAARRLGVYAYAYQARLVDALGSDYPALQHLLKIAGFRRLAQEFVAAVPSRHRNLRWYGGELAGFLSRSPRWRRRPLLAELARFEWTLGLAFDAVDAAPATAEEVARVPAADWPGMRMRFHASVGLLRFRSNAPQVWRAATSGLKLPAAARRPRPAVWLVWRKGHEPFYRALAPAEAWALGAALRGLDFASLCGGLRRFVGAQCAAQTCAQLLRNWLAEGLVYSIETGQC